MWHNSYWVAGGRFLINRGIYCCGSANCCSFGTCSQDACTVPAIATTAPKCLWVDSLFLVQRPVINAPPIRAAVNEPHLWSVLRTSLGFSLRRTIKRRWLCQEMKASTVSYIVYTHPRPSTHCYLEGAQKGLIMAFLQLVIVKCSLWWKWSDCTSSLLSNACSNI